MTSNLVNIYAHIKNEYSQFDSSLIVPPTYIKTLTGLSNKIVFVYRYEGNSNSVNSPLSLNQSNGKRIDLDLTGSPLKDSCAIDVIDMSLDSNLGNINAWLDEEECFTTISMERARQFLINLNTEKTNDNSTGSIWVLCDELETTKTILLEIEKDSQWNIRGVVNFMGFSSLKDIQLSDLLEKHFSMIPNTRKLTTTIETYFNITSDMTLKLSWSTTSSNPSLATCKYADVVLYQTIPVENKNSCAEVFWRQLYILNVIKKNILEYKEVDDDKADPVFNGFSSGIEMNELKQKISEILNEVNVGSSESTENDNKSSCDLEEVIIKCKTRDYVDITDKLWQILKMCSSYKDLKTALNFIFQCATKSGVVNYPDNENRLAELIREVSQQRLAKPCFSGSEPLELLLEIGLEKITKDYEYIFTESKICSVNDLKIQTANKMEQNDAVLNVRKSLHNAAGFNHHEAPQIQRKTLLHGQQNSRDSIDNTGFQNSNFKISDIELRLAKLGQIQLMLEHLLLIQINLNVNSICSSAAKDMLSKNPIPFDILEKMGVDKMEISILNDNILPTLEDSEPNARRIVLNSENNFRKVESVFYHSLEPIFPTSVFPRLISADNQGAYSNIHYTKIATKRC